jgi:hypothetical protein
VRREIRFKPDRPRNLLAAYQSVTIRPLAKEKNMRRTLTLLIALAAFCGCASVSTNAPNQRPQKSYYARVSDGVLNTRSTMGPSTIIWIHPPDHEQIGMGTR